MYSCRALANIFKPTRSKPSAAFASSLPLKVLLPLVSAAARISFSLASSRIVATSSPWAYSL